MTQLLKEAALRNVLLDLLRAPYRSGGTPFAITNACIFLDHPDKYAPGDEPAFTKGGCICGMRKGTA